MHFSEIQNMPTTVHLVWKSVVNNSHIEYKKHAILILFLTSGRWSILYLGCALKLPQVLVYCLLLASPYVLPFPLFLCLLNVHFLQSSRGKSQVFTKDTQFLVIKRPLHFAQQVQALWSSCISLITDNVLMWGSYLHCIYLFIVFVVIYIVIYVFIVFIVIYSVKVIYNMGLCGTIY